MKMKMSVEMSDGTTQTLSISPLAVIGWERSSGRRMTDLSGEGGGMGMEDMVRMVYEQAKLQGLTTAEFEVWAAQVADIDPVDAADPTSGDEEA